MSGIEVLVGNPQPRSRTRLIAEELAAQVAARSGARVQPTIDLADHASRIFIVPEPTVDALLARVAGADLLVVASPTYKASYTGLLKAFLDRYGTDALRGVVAVPMLTVGSPGHALAVEFTLRPLLVELGASVPSRGIAFPAGDTDDRERIVAEWLASQWDAIGRAVDGRACG